ncbi:hypothetical protein [Staphylococcus agnetis]|uniref:hypothetical protein n=1 Tax=Staphylococcus agnetis TaxID=985762 RepID=UPI0021CF9176|nr:hypothetical protein [Staphylococcus agnetis]UXU59010.1 hypothetical protein MUA97_08960 [Staphylococcus agnetis]UXU61336.1 hypothetical protein MUA43_08960 [Staphylococcus agnetis]
MTNQEICELFDEVIHQLKSATLHLDDEDVFEIDSAIESIESVACNYEEEE